MRLICIDVVSLLFVLSFANRFSPLTMEEFVLLLIRCGQCGHFFTMDPSVWRERRG